MRDAAAPVGATRVRRSRLTPAGAALAIVIVVLLFALAVPVRTLFQQRADLARLQREERALGRQNAVLRVQVARLHDPAYIERVARECLGMTKPGEIAFVVVPKNPTTAGSKQTAPFDPSVAAGGC